MAGHIQPRIECHWDYRDFGALPNVEGYDESYPCPLSDYVRSLLNRTEFRGLDGFYQGQEAWCWPSRRSDRPPAEGDGWFLFEFWTADVPGVEKCFEQLCEELRNLGVPLNIKKET